MANNQVRTKVGDGWYQIPTNVRITCELYRMLWLHNRTTIDGTLQIDGRIAVGG